MRGSKYELKFDFQGNPINEDEIRLVLKKAPNEGSHKVITGLGVESSSEHDQHQKQGQGVASSMLANQNMISKDQIMAQEHPHGKPGPKNPKKKTASEDDQMMHGD